MKICFDINKKVKVEFHGNEIEPEIAIRTENDLIEIFGKKEELITFAETLYESVITNKK